MNGAVDFEKFDQFVSSKLSETRLPSVTVLLIENGKPVHSVAFGFKDIASASPASVTTLYGIGSITKSFTALAIGKLVEEGKLAFHDKVTKYLNLKPRAFREIEIHHLLTHTSGIPGLGYSEVRIYSATGSYTRPSPIPELGDVASFLADVDDWVEAKPGEKMFYLNEGYYLLGDIISKVSGHPYETYVLEEILRPLRMRRTYFAKEQIESDADRATPYIVKDEKTTASVNPSLGGSAAGGLVSNVVDLGNFMTMLMDDGVFEGKRLVTKETLEKMETPYVNIPRATFPGEGYGYGLEIIPDFYGHKLVYHGGSVEVFTASLAYLPRLGIGVTVMANGSGYSMERTALYGVALLMGQNPDELPAIKLENILKKVEGTYAAYRNTVVAEVKRNGSFLILSGEDIGEKIILVPDSQDSDAATFFTLSGAAKLPLEFRFRKDGVEMLYERYKYRKTGPLRET
jgi:CubicO group peptidase (beta-lactamase class C family)